MARILKLKATGNYQHYHVSSKADYKTIGKRKGEAIYSKIKEVPPERVPEIEEAPIDEEENVKVIVFLQIDYGLTGHSIEFDCWVSRVFEANDSKIESWISQTKQYMIDKIVGFGFNALEGVILGTEITTDEMTTFEPFGFQEEKFQYSHDGSKWFNI